MKFYATFGALALFGAYSLIRTLIRRAVKKQFNPKISQHPLLIRDIQLEILNIILRDASSKDEDLNNLALVCKEWNKLICNDQIWLNKFQILLNNKININRENTQEIKIEQIRSIFGCVSDLLPPRTVYYILRPKLKFLDHEDGSVAKFTPDLIQVPQEKVWMPWLNHNIIQRPDTLWKFIYTIIRYPRWIFPMINSYTCSGHMPFTKPDSCNSKRFDKILLIISCFSVLPWLDMVISNTPSVTLLWDRPMWPIFAQIQAFLCLISMQLFDNSFNNKRFYRIRVALAIITMLLTKGLKSSIYTSVLILCKFLPEEVAKHWILPLIVLIMALMISYPIATILLVIMALILVWDSVVRGLKNSPRKISYARYFFLLNIATILWAMTTSVA